MLSSYRPFATEKASWSSDASLENWTPIEIGAFPQDVLQDGRFERWPFTSPFYEPTVMNGLRIKQFLESKIRYARLDVLDYFEVHCGRGGLYLFSSL